VKVPSSAPIIVEVCARSNDKLRLQVEWEWLCAARQVSSSFDRNISVHRPPPLYQACDLEMLLLITVTLPMGCNIKEPYAN
jgi:hypothetical protein